MAIVLEKPARKTRVSRSVLSKEYFGRFCIVCGNRKEDDLSFGYKSDGNDRVKVDICKSLSTCAKMVSTLAD